MSSPTDIDESTFKRFRPLTTSTQGNVKEPRPGTSKSLGSSSWADYLVQKYEDTKENEQITSSQYRLQSATDYWTTRTWKEMETEYYKERNSNIKLLTKQVNQHVGFLSALIVSVDCPDTFRLHNVTLNLMDPTGEMKAIIPRELYNEHIGDLIEQSVIVLRNFRVLSLLPYRQCLIVAKSNLQTIFSARLDGNGSITTKIALIAERDIQSKLKEDMTRGDEKTGEETVKQGKLSVFPASPPSNVFETSGLNFDFEDSPRKIPKRSEDGECAAQVAPMAAKRFKFGHNNKKQPLEKTIEVKQMKKIEKTVETIEPVETVARRLDDDELFNDICDDIRELDTETTIFQPVAAKVPKLEMSIRTHDPKDTQLVEALFDGMDASMMFDEF